MNTSQAELSSPSTLSVRVGLNLTLIGFLVFTLGAKPEWFGMDRSPVVGFVQIVIFVVGLGVLSLGGYIGLIALWGNEERSIAADIGLRLVATGYVLAVFTGMADLFGMGTQPLPDVPFFGPLQALGMELGEAVIAIGFLITIPYKLLWGNVEK